MKSRDYFNTLRMLFMALATGQVLFAGVAYYLQSQGQMGLDEEGEMGQIFLVLGLVMGIGGIFGGNYVYKQLLAKARGLPSLKEKLMQYRTANIVRYALLEGAAIFSLVGYLLTGAFNLLIMAGGLIVWFITLAPSQSRAIEDLELPTTERQQVEDPEAIIE